MSTSLITLTVTQTVRIALRIFAMGTYMHSVGDSENVSKNTICICMYSIYLSVFAVVKLNHQWYDYEFEKIELLCIFVSFLIPFLSFG